MKASWSLAVGVITLAAGVAGGQVRRLSRGRALDVNYRIGSLGVNSIRQANRALDGNLLITGQVTGGFQFRGTVGYAGANQLRIDVPSAGLDDFIRSSAGLERMTSGGTYGPSAYYSSQRTVVGAGGIGRGVNVPAGSIPRATYVPAGQAHRLYDSAVKAYEPILLDMSDQLRVNPLISPMPAGPESARQGISPRDLPGEPGAVRPAASVLFGILRRQDQQRPGEEPGEGHEERSAAFRGQPGKCLDAKVSARPPERTERPSEQEEPSVQELPRPGQDVFVDMLIEMQRMREEARQAAEGQSPAAEQPQPSSPSPGASPAPEENERPARRRGEQAVKRVRNRLILYSLAGKNRDMFNRHMALAQKAMSAGRFYRAAGHYEVAVVLNRANPLGHLGWALALFAANEPLSSALHLRDALKRFPPLMETGVDVDRLIGKRLVDTRIEQIERRLANRAGGAKASLIFLAAFVRSARGETQKAADHARKLIELSDDEVHHAYAELLLKARARRKEPTTRKAS